jgi:hypothetical protein
MCLAGVHVVETASDEFVDRCLLDLKENVCPEGSGCFLAGQPEGDVGGDSSKV